MTDSIHATFATKNNCHRMKNNRITFIGSANHASARTANSGECSHTVNLERHNTTLRPSASYNFAGSISGSNRKICFIHTCGTEQHLISVDETTLYHEGNIVDNALVSINKKLTTLGSTLCDMSAIGNTLIITTTQQILYIAYRKEGYKILGNKPPMPILRLNEKCIEYYGYSTPEVVFDGCIEKPSEENYDFFLNHIMGPIYKVRDEIHQHYGFFEPILVRYALRLFDGSHILPSPPILINFQNYNKLLEYHYLTFNYKQPTDKTYLHADYILWNSMGIEYIADSINLDEWKDIVTGIDIFVSKELSLIEDRAIDEHSYYDKNGNKSDFAYKYKIPTLKSSNIEQNVLGETVFYLLTTLNIDDIVANTPTLIKHEIKPHEIIYRPIMEVDTLSLGTIGAQHSLVYNNRLHLADITYRHYPGYPPILFTTNSEEEHDIALIYMRTKITQPNGGIEETTAVLTVPNFNMTLSPLISYPDANAYSMEIGIRYKEYEYKKRVSLQACDNENRASFIAPNALCMDVSEWYKVATTSQNTSDFPSVTTSFVTHQRNRMIVSENSNPFHFPNELSSYYISNGTINGLSTATAALSQGQFGEYPLYIFTTEGIWSMQVGTDDICYTRCTPLNNEYTNKQGFILPIERAVIYLSGNNISLISGSQSKVLLPLNEIETANFNNTLPKLLPKLSIGCCDSTPIIKYIDPNTTATYNHKKNELILCNNNYPYCWILHIPSGHLYRRELSLKSIISNGDTLLAQSNNNIIYNLNSEIESVCNVHLITKPLQFAPDMYTRLRQVVWRIQAAQCALSLCILAAHEPDGAYKVIYQSKYEGFLAGHLPLRVFSAPYKFYRLALWGTITPDATIDAADLAYDIVENNKLR